MDLKCICAWLLAAIIVVSANADQELTKVPIVVARTAGPTKIREHAEKTDTKPITEAVSFTLSSPNEDAAQEPQIEIVELPVNDDEMQELFALHDEMEKEALAAPATAVSPQDAARLARALTDSAPVSADALNDEDINKLMQIIPLPSANEKEINTAETDIATMDSKADTTIDKRDVLSTSGRRTSRALRPHGYYILAFAPVDGPLVPTYTKLDIIPAERALDGDLAVRRATKQRHDYSDLQMSSSEVDEARLISKKKFNRYIRRLMKQIRKGTRKIQRKTRFKSKSNTPEPTVENFLHKLYAQRGAQKKKKSSWFSW